MIIIIFFSSGKTYLLFYALNTSLVNLKNRGPWSNRFKVGQTTHFFSLCLCTVLTFVY
ncbi:hypothetical protein BD770DRAFT_380922 [Pilaira anomala]|nr:hypothetical protein BD770DRAFT_380922 [Pilaira anomala]